MDAKVNDYLKGMVEAVEATKPQEAPKPREDVEPEPFQFMDGRDKAGLPLEHVSYVKRSCKDCSGRGFIRLLIGDGYRPLLGPSAPRERFQKARDLRACFCVNKGYVRVHKEFDRRWAALFKDEKFAPHSEAEEWAARVNLVVSMGFTAPPVPEKTAPAPADV